MITAFVPAPVITAISDDTGPSGTDAITNDQTLIFSGSLASTGATTIEFYIDGTLVGTGSAAMSWSFDYTGTTLAE